MTARPGYLRNRRHRLNGTLPPKRDFTDVVAKRLFAWRQASDLRIAEAQAIMKTDKDGVLAIIRKNWQG